MDSPAGGPTDPEMAALRAQMADLGPLEEVEIALPRDGRRLTILRPADLDFLLERGKDEPELMLPYWREIWPSGLALADAIAAQPELVRGKRVLEVGPGLGITAAVALQAGADLTVVDYAPEALLLTRHTTRRNAGAEPIAHRLNWRRPDPDFWHGAAGAFDVFLGADLLYEWRDLEGMLNLPWQVLPPGGLLWLAEPGRAVAAMFLELAREIGWAWTTETHPGPWPEERDAGVEVRLHAFRRPERAWPNRAPQPGAERGDPTEP